MPEDGGGVRTARLDAAKHWPDVLVPDDAQAAAGGAGNPGDAVLARVRPDPARCSAPRRHAAEGTRSSSLSVPVTMVVTDAVEINDVGNFQCSAKPRADFRRGRRRQAARRSTTSMPSLWASASFQDSWLASGRKRLVQSWPTSCSRPATRAMSPSVRRATCCASSSLRQMLPTAMPCAARSHAPVETRGTGDKMSDTGGEGDFAHPADADQRSRGEHVAHHRQTSRPGHRVVGHRQHARGDHRVLPDMLGEQRQAGIGVIERGEDFDHDARKGR